jgi:F0F1-type ATP synthase membrane subunit c/vacuolar-type H+-ATPase subunit K
MATKKQHDDREGDEDVLTSIVRQAIAVRANAVELEYDSAGHLEVAFMVGNSGVGSAITDKAVARALVSAIGKKAKLGGKPRGTMTVAVDGQEHKVAVETHDHFGEHAYRLEFKKAR